MCTHLATGGGTSSNIAAAGETDIRSFAKFRSALTSEAALEQAKALARAEGERG